MAPIHPWPRLFEVRKLRPSRPLPSPHLIQTPYLMAIHGLESWSKVWPKDRTSKKVDHFVVLFPKPRHVWPQFPPIAKRRAASSIANITAGAPAARYTAKALHTRPLWDGDDGDSVSGFSSGSESTTCQGTGNSRKPISFLPSNMGFPLKFC